MGCPAQLDIHRKIYTRSREMLWGGDFSQHSNSKSPLKFPSYQFKPFCYCGPECIFLLTSDQSPLHNNPTSSFLLAVLFRLFIRYDLSNLCCQWFDLSNPAALFWYFCLWSIALFCGAKQNKLCTA